MKVFFILLFTCLLNVVLGQKKDQLVIVETSIGSFTMVLFEETPKHKSNFLKLVEEDSYDSTYFHRILKGFVVQGGDIEGQVGRSLVETIDPEFHEAIKHDYGMVGAARQSDKINPEKKSSPCQFYIVQSKTGAHHLDGTYTVFGKVIEGMDVVDQIAESEVTLGGKPIDPIYISVSIKRMRKKKIQKLFDYVYPVY